MSLGAADFKDLDGRSSVFINEKFNLVIRGNFTITSSGAEREPSG